MRDETVAREYAETLFALAERHEGVAVFGRGVDLVTGLLDEDPEFRLFLETPRIEASQKKALMRKVFERELPVQLVNFLLVVIDKRRQRLLRQIAQHFRALVDEKEGRAHVEVTLARPVDDTTMAVLTRRLSELLGATAVPHVRVRPEILGGVVVRTGDTIFDGSVRRQLDGMRRQLLKAKLPTGSAG
ncbi:MAG: ATP synthase F1 subunit delta [Gemmatimonadetes bacterium]|nr:ATP synthase F1 subunit delta [Gemmatimonadota bacterium]